MKKLSRFIVLTIVLSMIFINIGGIFNKSEAAWKKTADSADVDQFKFNATDVLAWAAEVGANGIYNKDSNHEKWPFVPTVVTDEDVASNKIIPLTGFDGLSDNDLATDDAANILVGLTSSPMATFEDKTEDIFLIAKNISEKLPSVNKDDIEVTYTTYMPGIRSANISKKDPLEVVIKAGKVIKSAQNRDQILEEYAKEIYLSGEFASTNPITGEPSTSEAGTEDDWNAKQENEIDHLRTRFVFLGITATLPNGVEYKLVVGGLGENNKGEKYANNWCLLRTKEEKTEKPDNNKFETELEYTAVVGGKNVGGKKEGETFLPNYDESNPEKDADVTAKIKSITGNDIVKVNDKDLKSDGTPNEDGWYYIDVNDKKVIAKDYKFDNYDNTNDNGIVKESGVKLTSSDGLNDTKNINIKWPFRIIKITKSPENPDESTSQVRVEITTNLPIDKNELPEGWNFTSDDEGKSQHRIYREFKKGDGDFDKDIVVKANGRTDTDSKRVTITWKKPTVLPKTGESAIIILAIIGLISFAAVVRTRKLNKNK